MLSSKVAMSFFGNVALSRLRLQGSKKSDNLAMLIEARRKRGVQRGAAPFAAKTFDTNEERVKCQK